MKLIIKIDAEKELNWKIKNKIAVIGLFCF